MTFAALMDAVAAKKSRVVDNAAYYAAVELVARIDTDLTAGARHYRAKSGRLLTTLDEVINAILANELDRIA